jgi:hypothetical protein
LCRTSHASNVGVTEGGGSVATVELARSSSVRGGGPGALERRALVLWPRLDRAALRRCRNDARRIAALVARRTTMPPEAIFNVLTMPSVADDDIGTWFG